MKRNLEDPLTSEEKNARASRPHRDQLPVAPALIKHTFSLSSEGVKTGFTVTKSMTVYELQNVTQQLMWLMLVYQHMM